MTEPASAVSLRAITRHFGDVKAVDGIDVEVADGEFFSLLGPSGSGKTTCLRLIGGFERPDSGTIQIFGEQVQDKPPFARPVNTVFQDYALFPHMTVANNIGYGLRLKKLPKSTIRERVGKMLDLVQLPQVADRRPSQLSGGQKQRISLARALVNEPKILLLDEPLGALDLKLRQSMQVELKAIQKQVGITFVYVTHDQEEALAMSDRLAIFNQGKIEQIGSPQEVYDRPKTGFVADFVGASNRFAGALAKRLNDSEQPFIVRPEKIRLQRGEAPDGYRSIEGRVVEAIFLGPYTQFHVEVEGQQVRISIQNTEPHDFSIDQPVTVAFHPDEIRLLEP
ncbi:MAG: ABC transporter ATP-binding protein [Myxococcota bacterium]